jgi:ubiquinol-cytochrome c reductase cytochrome b subunit
MARDIPATSGTGYGNALNPAETKALVSFLMTLRGNNLAPAADASSKLVNSSEVHLPPAYPPSPTRQAQ